MGGKRQRNTKTDKKDRKTSRKSQKINIEMQKHKNIQKERKTNEIAISINREKNRKQKTENFLGFSMETKRRRNSRLRN